MCRGQWTGVPTGPGVTNCTPTDPPPSWTGPRGVGAQDASGSHTCPKHPTGHTPYLHTPPPTHLSHMLASLPTLASGMSSAIHGLLPTMKTPSEQTRLLRWQSAVGMVGMVGLPVGCLWYPELVFYAAHMGRSPQVWPDPIPPKHSVAGITRYDTRLDTGPRCRPPLDTSLLKPASMEAGLYRGGCC